MGSPISPSDIVAITKFAWDLYQGCLAASSEFAAVGREAASMRSILRMTKVFILDKKDSILNSNTKEGKALKKELQEQSGRCLTSLQDLDKLLKKYGAMTWLDKLSWATGGKGDVAEVQSQMASSCTHLNTFFSGVNTWGLGVVNENVKKNGVGLDAIEDALSRNGGNEKKSVKEIMGVVGRSASREDAKIYKNIISEYAEEVTKSQQCERQGRSKTPDPVKRGENGKLGVNTKEKRPQSEGPAKSGKVNKEPDKKSNKKPANFTLECWLVKKGLSTERMEKQNRGQEAIKAMAENFKSSNKSLREGDDVVKWVLEAKNPDKDSRYVWSYLASRAEKVDAPVLGMGLRQEIMIIVKRQMTPEARKAADEKEKKEAARKAAAAKKAKEEKEKAKKLKQKKDEEKKKKKKEDEKKKEVKENEEKKPLITKPESASNGKDNGKVQNDPPKKKESKETGNYLKPDDNKEKVRRKSDASSVSTASEIRRTKSDAGLGKKKDKPREGKKDSDTASTVSKKAKQGSEAKKAASETGKSGVS